jgi:tRNA C32,U32 (ribose-2'-O)-methylase TrmJ
MNYAAPFSSPSVIGYAPQLVFGNEKTGISTAMSELGDGDFTIPMMGLTESFNVSVAAAICVHWGRHAREVAIGRATDLSEEDSTKLLHEYQSAGKHYEHRIRV